jgi:hypothetical protein
MALNIIGEADMDKDPNRIEPSESQVEYVSLRQLNNERLKGLNGRFGDEPETIQVEPSHSAGAPNPFDTVRASAPDETKTASNTLQNIQRKFSTSWLNMQHYLGDRKQNRDWDTKFK